MRTNSAIYTGWVRHRRHHPVTNEFRYRLFMMYLDLDELPRLFDGRWLWSARRAALAWFRRTDYVGSPDKPLSETIRELVEERTGTRPRGPIRLLTHLRYFGYCFNPVSFYYCFDEADERVDTIVAEVSNTPWRERHCYVLPASMDVGKKRVRRFLFRKDFHVSPFMGMEHDYDWRFTDPGSDLFVHMENREDGRRVFDATMMLEREKITSRSLARSLVRFPFMTGQVVSLIYWQALRLWWKKAPFHPHPKTHHSGSAGTPAGT